MRTLQQEINYRVEKHGISEVLDRLADVVSRETQNEELVKTLESAVAIALRIEMNFESGLGCDIDSNHPN
jgi:hypothetical protein